MNYNTKKFSIKDKVALELTSRITGENEFIPKPAKRSHDQVTPCRKKMQTKKIPILNLDLAGSIIRGSGFLSKSYTLQPIKKALIKFVRGWDSYHLMESTIHEHLFFCEVKVTHKVTHISKCTSSFPEFLESAQRNIKQKTSTQKALEREYIQPSGYANFLYALVDAVTESKKRELIHFLRVI